MIRADDLSDLLDVDINAQETIEFELPEVEQALLYSLDADVEAAAAFRRPGELFEISFTREISTNVLAALKRTWEAGGWVVGAFEITDPETLKPLREQEGPTDQHVFRLVFARPHKKQRLASKVVLQALEARTQAEEFVVPSEATIERITSGRTRTSTPLLIRMPTRSRPRQALEVLQKYRDMATEHVAIEVIIDEDDQLSNNTQFLQCIADLDCVVTVGRHKNKIEACNGGRVEDWSILMLCSDDMWPIIRGYDQKIMNAFDKHAPLFDHAINFNDGYNKDHVRIGEPVTNTLPIVGRHLYEDYGRRIYDPGYKSIYCDTDETFRLNALNRMIFIDEIIIEHRHYANAKAQFDDLYEFNSRHDNSDKELFEVRRERGFDATPPVLSVLICSISSRRRQLERLVDYLRWQLRKPELRRPVLPGTPWALTPVVEICVDLDDHLTVGEKRQHLLERAVGEYVCFIDDDDWVHERFIERLLKACNDKKDCCTLRGIITENGNDPRKFDHSLANDGWYTRDNGSYARTPNHLNAVRRELALKAGFVARSTGEDHLYSQALLPLLSSEADTGSEPLYYYWSIPANSVQSVK